MKVQHRNLLRTFLLLSIISGKGPRHLKEITVTVADVTIEEAPKVKEVALVWTSIPISLMFSCCLLMYSQKKKYVDSGASFYLRQWNKSLSTDNLFEREILEYPAFISIKKKMSFP